MILTNRLFEREPPSREAKSIYIFCEGIKREVDYFIYFKELDSRINIEVHQLMPYDDNSPLGLIRVAEQCILKTEETPNPKYNFIEGDEVWIVLDTDIYKNFSREPQLKRIRETCQVRDGWNVAISNPCFEVWLYYHKFDVIPDIEGIERCRAWKSHVNNVFSGGFDSRRHPIFIETAKNNSLKNYAESGERIHVGSTQVHNLANSIIPLISDKIQRVLSSL